MASTRLVSSLLLALALAGCGGPSLTGTATRAGTVSAASTNAWVHPSQISTPDDPALEQAEWGGKSHSGDEPIVNFKQVDPVLYRGGLPSLKNLQDLKAMGIKTDITLMGEIPIYDSSMVRREKGWAETAGLKFVQVKVPTGKVPLSGKMSNAIVDQFLKVALDPANQPCFVHCLHGRDRTGTIVASYQISQHGMTNADALAEMKTFGFDPNDYPKLAAFVAAYVPTPAFKVQ